LLLPTPGEAKAKAMPASCSLLQQSLEHLHWLARCTILQNALFQNQFWSSEQNQSINGNFILKIELAKEHQ
jgi:hypothetical protein